MGADTPEWLQHNDADIQGAAVSGSGSLAGDDDVENSKEGKPSKRASRTSTRLSGSSDSPASKISICSLKTIFLAIVSILFFGVFVYSATTQDNDADGWQWTIFYSLNAALVAAFVVYYVCCFPLKVLYLLATAMGVWSIVYIVIAALKFKDAPKGGPDAGTGDNDNMTEREEIGFEMGGAALGLLSALYHVCIAKCCINKEGKKPEE
jgi:hypothetical protein